MLVACNFTPVPRHNYRVGVPTGGFWQEVLNSDALDYGGSGHGNLGGLEADAHPLPWPAPFLESDFTAVGSGVFEGSGSRQ